MHFSASTCCLCGTSYNTFGNRGDSHEDGGAFDCARQFEGGANLDPVVSWAAAAAAAVFVRLVAGAVVDYGYFEGLASASVALRRVQEEFPRWTERGVPRNVLPFYSVAWDGEGVPQGVFDGSFVGDVEVVGLHDYEDCCGGGR